MWIFTQARDIDGQRFLIDIKQYGMVCIDKYADAVSPKYVITAGTRPQGWTLATFDSEEEAQDVLEFIFEAIAHETTALDMSMSRNDRNDVRRMLGKP